MTFQNILAVFINVFFPFRLHAGCGKLGMEYLCSQNWRLMIIETEHLIIRDFQEKDAVGLLEYLSHPRVNCFVSERLCSEESALAYISNTPKELLRYAVCLKEDDFIIGDVLHCVKKPTHSTWAGISNQRFEGKGIGA